MFLTDNAKLDGTPNKAKLNEKYTLVFILFQVLKITLIKKIQLPVFLFLVVFYQLLRQQISFLQSFIQHFIQHYLKKIFVTNFPFFHRFTPGHQKSLERKFFVDANFFGGITPSHHCYPFPWILHWKTQNECFWDNWGKLSWGLAIQTFP